MKAFCILWFYLVVKTDAMYLHAKVQAAAQERMGQDMRWRPVVTHIQNKIRVPRHPVTGEILEEAPATLEYTPEYTPEYTETEGTSSSSSSGLTVEQAANLIVVDDSQVIEHDPADDFSQVIEHDPAPPVLQQAQLCDPGPTVPATPSQLELCGRGIHNNRCRSAKEAIAEVSEGQEQQTVVNPPKKPLLSQSPSTPDVRENKDDKGNVREQISLLELLDNLNRSPPKAVDETKKAGHDQAAKATPPTAHDQSSLEAGSSASAGASGSYSPWSGSPASAAAHDGYSPHREPPLQHMTSDASDVESFGERLRRMMTSGSSGAEPEVTDLTMEPDNSGAEAEVVAVSGTEAHDGNAQNNMLAGAPPPSWDPQNNGYIEGVPLWTIIQTKPKLLKTLTRTQQRCWLETHRYDVTEEL